MAAEKTENSCIFAYKPLRNKISEVIPRESRVANSME